MPRAVTDEIEVRSRAALRDWLAANHARTEGVWLIHHKRHSPHYVPFDELVGELLCWGWIDAVPRTIDADRSAHRIAPRKPTSAWSAVNKAKVGEARADGAMTPAGEAAIARAEANGMWTFLDDVERCEVPRDLADALGSARDVWDCWPRSVRRGTLEWIKTAKTAATRARRITEAAAAAREGRRPKPFQRRGNP